MNKSSLTFLFALLVFSSRAQYGRGLVSEIIDTNMVQFKDYSGIRAPLPSSYSLEAYAPEVGNQGQVGSCVSWASAYCAFTIIRRIETGNKYLEPFSALDLHNRIKASESEPPCSYGARISVALEMIKNYGVGRKPEVCDFQSANVYYNDKLFQWRYLNKSILEIKKALFSKNPVVIAANFYEDDWGKVKNHENGVWNGYYSGAQDGGHAMCVIAYDDNKNGGAFKIQNSWGNLWSENGYFWIKYDDFFKVVEYVYALSPRDGYELEDSNKITNTEVNASYFRVQNNCSLKVYVALSQRVAEEVQTIGWYAVESGSSIDLDISERSSNDFYWMATAWNGDTPVDWYDVLGTDRCMSRDKFNFSGIQSSDCPEKKPFYREDPTKGTYYQLQNLSCPNIATRGEEIQLSASNSKSCGISLNYSDKDNINWTGGALIDPYTGKQILESNADDGSYYEVSYIKKGKIYDFKGDATELQQIHFLKFANRQTAAYWLAYIESSKL